MDNSKILKATIQVFQECKVKSFPIDCFALLKHYDYRIYTYDEIKKKNIDLYEICIDYSNDAFCDRASRLIAYNSQMPKGRVRFSLMHELGHHILRHSVSNPQTEREANMFASYILAPRMAIHYAECKNANDVYHAFDLSFEASEFAFDDYRRWHRNIVIYKMSRNDKEMYDHFYDAAQKKFIWSIKKCDYCGRTLYNTIANHCRFCSLPEYYDSLHSFNVNSHEPLWEDNMRKMRALEYKWLYDV